MSEIDQALKVILGEANRIVEVYDEGGSLVVTKNIACIKYNTGDCIWLINIDGEYCVNRIDTHDDIQWIASSKD